MKQIASIGLCLALAVGAFATNATAQSLAGRPVLDFTGAPSPTGEDTVYSPSVAARFAGVPLAQDWPTFARRASSAPPTIARAP